MSQSMQESPNEAQIKQLFTKAYGQPGPTPDQWKAIYANNVHFIDPTQERRGIDAYILAQNNLLQRCDDVFLEPHSIAFNKDVAFIEWTMGLKIQGIEFIYPGATRMTFGTDRKIIEHRDYFDFVGPTFGPIPILGNFTRWLYKRFVA
jgi:hypothetical protein